MQTSFQNISKIETGIPNDIVPLNMQPHKKINKETNQKGDTQENGRGPVNEYLIQNPELLRSALNMLKQDKQEAHSASAQCRCSVIKCQRFSGCPDSGCVCVCVCVFVCLFIVRIYIYL